MTSFDDRLEEIAAFPQFVKATFLAADSDEQLVDALGMVNSTQTAIGGIKLGAASEIETETEGAMWRYEQGRKGMRSFNNAGMFATLMRELDFESLTNLLLFLMERDIIRLTWQWSKLEKLLRIRNIQLRIADHQISDGDPDFEMGEYWETGSTSYKRLEEDVGQARTKGAHWK